MERHQLDDGRILCQWVTGQDCEGSTKRRWRLVKRIQKLIASYLYAKTIAVKQVTTNKGRTTLGIDEKVWRRI